MKITRIKYFPIERTSDKHPLIACSLVFDDVFMIHDVKVFKGEVVVMPQRRLVQKGFVKTNQTKSTDLCHPVDKAFFEYIKEHVFEGYYNYLATGERVYNPE